MQIFNEKEQKAGAFNFTKSIYRQDEYEPYLPYMDTTEYDEKGVVSYYNTFYRTFQMSDHLPLWVELKVDFSGQYLEELKEKYQSD